MRETYQPLSSIVSSVGIELGLSLNPLNIMNSVDKDSRQIGFLVRETCLDLLTRKPWRKIIGTNPWVLKANQELIYDIVDDDDTPLFDSLVIKLGSKWRYLNAKGLTYDEIFRAYEKRIYDFAFDYNSGETVNLNANSFAAPSRP